MEPSKKSPAIEGLITIITGKHRPSIIRAGLCITCGEKATEFKDALSAKEYTISGMCQDCQDKTFE